MTLHKAIYPIQPPTSNLLEAAIFILYIALYTQWPTTVGAHDQEDDGWVALPSTLAPNEVSSPQRLKGLQEEMDGRACFVAGGRCEGKFCRVEVVVLEA